MMNILNYPQLKTSCARFTCSTRLFHSLRQNSGSYWNVQVNLHYTKQLSLYQTQQRFSTFHKKAAEDALGKIDLSPSSTSMLPHTSSSSSTSSLTLKNPRTLPPKARNKLQKSLEKSDPKVYSDATHGILDAMGADIEDILTEALSSTEFQNDFRGVMRPGDVIEIENVKMSVDSSTATAFWSSMVIDEFSAFLSKNVGEAECKRVITRAKKIVNSKLQVREPQFRSYLVKHMDFKRVPRIVFRPADNRREDDIILE